MGRLACFCILLGNRLAWAANKTEEDVVAFRKGGWFLSRQLLATDEVRTVAATLEDLLSEHGRRAFGNEGEKEVRFTFAVHELDRTVADFVSKQSGSLWQEAARLAGTEELCVLMDRGFAKDPGDPETHWHRDDEAVGIPALHGGIRTVHAWIPLKAMGKELGTLRYLIGTHRREYEWYEQLLASLWGWEFAWFATSRTEQDDALELGDVAWHDGFILHSAGSNQGQQVRNGLAISYAYCAYPDRCQGATQRVSAQNPACRATDVLFDKTWKERHRKGENDYSKNMIAEPFENQLMRFIFRSIAGALAGLGIHAVVTRFTGSQKDRKTD